MTDPIKLKPRVSARYVVDTRTASERSADFDRRVLALFDDYETLCSVEVAHALSDFITHAKSSLVRLERRGLLTSTRVPAPKSGNGRRMFRLAP